MILMVAIIAVFCGLTGGMIAMVLMHKVTPDLRASVEQVNESLWHKTGAICTAVAVLTVMGILALWLGSKIWTSNFGPDLHPVTCTDRTLPSKQMYDITQYNVNNNGGLSYTYQVCTTTTTARR